MAACCVAHSLYAALRAEEQVTPCYISNELATAPEKTSPCHRRKCDAAGCKAAVQPAAVATHFMLLEMLQQCQAALQHAGAATHCMLRKRYRTPPTPSGGCRGGQDHSGEAAGGPGRLRSGVRRLPLHTSEPKVSEGSQWVLPGRHPGGWHTALCHIADRQALPGTSHPEACTTLSYISHLSCVIPGARAAGGW